MKICLISSLILSAGFQIVTTVAKQTGRKSLRRGLKSSKSGKNITYRRIKTRSNNDCIAVIGSKDNVITHTCSDNEYEQHWEYRSETNEIVNRYNYECLDLFGDGSVGTWPCHGRTNQKWEYDSYNERLINAENGQCMNIDSGNIDVFECDNDINQKFYLDPPTAPNRNGALIINAGHCLELSTSSGNNVSVEPCNQFSKQKWYYDSANKAFKSSKNDYCLDLRISDGNVLGWPCNYNSNQQWEWIYDSNLNYYRLKSLYNGKCLDRDPSNNIIVDSCHSGVYQKFESTLSPPSPPKSPTASPTVSPTMSPVILPTGESVFIKSGNRCIKLAYNKNVIIGNCVEERNEIWVVDYDRNEIMNEYNNKCLTTDNYNNVLVSACDGNNRQKWFFISGSIKSSDGQCLNFDSNSNIKLVNCDDSYTQDFYTDKDLKDTPTPIKNGDRCLGILSWNSKDAAMQYCDEEENQNWIYSNGMMKNTYSNKCLDVDLSNDEGNIIAWDDCHGRDNQQWALSSEGMKSLYNEKCMTVESNMSLKLYPCSGNPNQQFYYGEDTLSIVQQYLVFRDAMKGCLKMTSSGNVVSATCTDSDYSQQWSMDSQTKTLRNRLNGWCLDVDEQDGNNIIAWNECHGRYNQQWVIEGMVIRSMLSDSNDIAVATLNPSTKSIELQSYYGSYTQKFQKYIY